MADKKILLSQEWLQELQDELTHLKEVKRKEIADKLKEAISYWDLSENAEYAAAREDQAQVEGRIIELETMLKPGNYEIIDSKKAKKSGINIGSTVTVRKIDTLEESTYNIVGSQEANIFENKISNESPLGKALLGRNIGDKFTILPPSNKNIEYEIITIE